MDESILPKKGNDKGSKLSISSSEVEEKFQKKIKQVSLQDKELETRRFASHIGYPHINLETFPIGQQALRQIPREAAEELGVVCFFAVQDEIRLGAVDPASKEVQEILFELQERNHANGALYTISEHSLEHVLKLYDTLPTVKPITKDIEVKEEDLQKVESDIQTIHTLQPLLDEASTTDLVTWVLGAALKLGATDVHVEAEQEVAAFRFRLDGVLHDAAILPKDRLKTLVSRIKLVSSLKINITDKPQDGRFTIKLSAGDVDVRVSTIPTIYGESIVMRVLNQTQKGITFDSIGLRGDAYEKLKREIERPNGMIITTGPTGSGKTTTMYAVMRVLNKPGVKIITLEDPVEYKMEGINQSQIDHGKGYTFATGLRSILRQDPDIAMVGEIRDLETAEIAIQAALTGHLLLSTIHTNSAAGAIPRFLSMGVKPFLLAPALNSIIGQRLVRRLCEECKKPATLSEGQQERVDTTLAKLPEKEKQNRAEKKQIFYTAPGCTACGGIGYKGRIGIYEIFILNQKVEQLILSGQVSEYDMERIAVEDGMITMVQDGLLKALDGMTSVEEVFRVIE